MGTQQPVLNPLIATDPIKHRHVARAIALSFVVVVLWVALSPMSAWATTPNTSATNPPSTSAPSGSSPSTSSSTSSRTQVPTWMFVAGGALVLVAAGWMVQANRSRT